MRSGNELYFGGPGSYHCGQPLDAKAMGRSACARKRDLRGLQHGRDIVASVARSASAVHALLNVCLEIFS
jgi:hypothetical protein